MSPRIPPRFTADLSASVAVFLIALPFSLGVALATGSPLQAGLVAAAVGGIIAGRLGGAPLQVSGPAGGLTVVTAGLIQHYGWRTTCAITVLAGLCQLALALLRTARSALMVSPSVVHGMLAGVGVTIALAQLHIVLGGTPQSSAVANIQGLPAQLAAPHPAALAVSALTLTVLFGWTRLPGRAGRALRKVPAALGAVAAATAFAAFAGLSLPRVDLPSWRDHVLPALPEGPVLGILAAVLTVTLVGSVESLLSAVATDKLIASSRVTGDRPPRADLDRELRGQGVANIVSGALGGLPVAGGATRSVANVKSGAVSRRSSMLHGLWVLLAAGLLVPVLDLIPLAALAALVMTVGVQMAGIRHLRSVSRHREIIVYLTTLTAVVLGGVLEGVAIGVAVAVAIALHRLARTRITMEVQDDGRVHRVWARGQLTFLAVPRLSRVLGQIPQHGHAVIELDGSFIDHAAYETLQDWQDSHLAHGGSVEVTGRSGARIGEPGRTQRGAHHCCRPWTPWQNHCDHRAPEDHAEDPSTNRSGDLPVELSEAAPFAGPPAQAAPPAPAGPVRAVRPGPAQRRRGAGQLASGIGAFQRDTAPHVRDELARLAREGQRPSQLFLTCADSRLVTSMITASGPGDLFTVRNVGNLVPLPGAEATDDSVAAAIEYAVDVLMVDSITVCGHSGCGAMQALLTASPGAPMTPLRRWLRHGLPSLERMASRHHAWVRISGRLPADAVEQLCLTNVVQQLEHLRAHDSVARRLAEGTLELHGMYFHVGEAQAYLLSQGEDFFDCRVFDSVLPDARTDARTDARANPRPDTRPDTRLGSMAGTRLSTRAGFRLGSMLGAKPNTGPDTQGAKAAKQDSPASPRAATPV
ncbi:SulP family inorganic anion transporter [Streptomyces sp. G-G2]|uniref:SulP family inorganic anion transporter n=1 Tax=Streptomyces sp. G-G2 TaxID=3046201 RepID=UPI0024B9A142|nr:SulP family inorganic anion transporter [Streptomyces sp. G-G2]MDJ0384470.1 SulP family inorganic anion transporter [Streptomyces sp. G-G2]